MIGRLRSDGGVQLMEPSGLPVAASTGVITINPGVLTNVVPTVSRVRSAVAVIAGLAAKPAPSGPPFPVYWMVWGVDVPPTTPLLTSSIPLRAGSVALTEGGRVSGGVLRLRVTVLPTGAVVGAVSPAVMVIGVLLP